MGSGSIYPLILAKGAPSLIARFLLSFRKKRGSCLHDAGGPQPGHKRPTLAGASDKSLWTVFA
jgi:hypothetical protein